MKKRYTFTLFVLALSILLLPQVAVSANGGKFLPKQGVQIGIGHDFIDTDLEMSHRKGDLPFPDRSPMSVAETNRKFDFDFNANATYLYLKYGLAERLEVGGRLGISSQELNVNGRPGNVSGRIESDASFGDVYYGINAKAKLFESENGTFSSFGLGYDAGYSDNVKHSLTRNTLDSMQFSLFSADLLAGRNYGKLTPFIGVGYRHVRMEYEWDSTLSTAPRTDKYKSEDGFVGVAGVNIYNIDRIAINVEGAIGGGGHKSIGAQVGYEF